MRSMFLRILSLTLCLLFVLPLTMGCAKEGTNAGGSQSGATDPEGYQNPVEVVDLGGKEYTFMGSGWYEYAPLDYVDIAPEAPSGDMVGNAAFERLVYIENTYNCNIIFDGSLTDPREFNTKLEANTMAGDEAYDFVLSRGQTYITAINGEYFNEVSMYDVDTDSSWWDKSALDALTINGKNYGIVGDVTVNHLMAVWMVCFNKTLVSNYKLESPYEMVENGTWTYDRVIQTARSFASDSDGITGMGKQDLWGINYTRDTVMGILLANGIKIVEKDGNGVPQMVVTNYQSQIHDILTSLYDETFAADTMNKTLLCEESDTEVFDDDKCLFLFTATHNSTALRNSNVDYGMVPYPKASDDGDYISTAAGNFLTIVSFPKTNTDYENSGILLNAFAAFGQAKVRPQFYENVLLRKNAKDVESYDMLKYIFENLTYDIGAIYDITESAINDTSRTQDTGITTLIMTNRNIWRNKLKTLLLSFGITE